LSESLKIRLHAAMSHQKAGRLAQAEQIYQAVLAEDPSQPDAVHLLGLVRMEQDRDEEAVSLMEKALALYPDAPHFHHNIAGVYRRMGRLQEAEARFRAAIERKPDYGEAYQGLAEMVKFKADDPLFGQIAEQLARPDLADGILSYFHFAAGKIHDDVKDYRKAFHHFREGNRLTHRQFDAQAFRSLVKNLIYHYSPGHLRSHQGVGLDTETPVFIIGMPRSGTTLVEQILASHTAVFGAGELNDMKRLAASASQHSQVKRSFPDCVPGLPRAAYARLAENYLAKVTSLTSEPGIRRIIDKHPLNFQFVGLIYDLYPNARIIHTVRHPLDTCLSCFFQNFTKGQDYSFGLEVLGQFYNDYRRLMQHWEQLYPGRILTIRYEDIVENQEVETRRLLDFMGLEFEQACIDFHQTQRRVSTASFMQVRKPIYKSSRQRWVNYRQELAGLARIIGMPIDQPVTISGGSNRIRDSILS